MAMSNCRECGDTVSSEARACPHCGASHPDAERARTAGTSRTILLVLLVLAAVALAFFLVDQLVNAMADDPFEA